MARKTEPQNEQEGPKDGDAVIHITYGRCKVIRSKGDGVYECQTVDGKHVFDANVGDLRPSN